MIANKSDPAFKALAEFLRIPDNTIKYRLQFEAGGVVTVEAKFELVSSGEAP
jgi:hypothetical protein